MVLESGGLVVVVGRGEVGEGGDYLSRPSRFSHRAVSSSDLVAALHRSTKIKEQRKKLFFHLGAAINHRGYPPRICLSSQHAK